MGDPKKWGIRQNCKFQNIAIFNFGHFQDLRNRNTEIAKARGLLEAWKGHLEACWREAGGEAGGGESPQA